MKFPDTQLGNNLSAYDAGTVIAAAAQHRSAATSSVRDRVWGIAVSASLVKGGRRANN